MKPMKEWSQDQMLFFLLLIVLGCAVIVLPTGVYLARNIEASSVGSDCSHDAICVTTTPDDPYARNEGVDIEISVNDPNETWYYRDGGLSTDGGELEITEE